MAALGLGLGLPFGVVVGGTKFSAEAIALFARMSVAPSGAQK